MVFSFKKSNLPSHHLVLENAIKNSKLICKPQNCPLCLPFVPSNITLTKLNIFLTFIGITTLGSLSAIKSLFGAISNDFYEEHLI